MAAQKNSKLEEARAGAATLGDVLYGNKPQTLVLEEEWAALVQRIAAGDQSSLHTLYDRAHRLVFTLAVRITSNRETAEEVTVDVFHDVWRRSCDYDAVNGTVIGWIMNQARSRAIDRLRLEQRKKRVNPHSDDDALAPSPASDPHQTLEFAQLCGVVEKALVVLSPDERQAIETAYFAELTHAEVAERLNQPLGTVKTRIRSGLAKLRKALQDVNE
jgi:RNA polymerase sigma-70 factor, ECF subfamily